MSFLGLQPVSTVQFELFSTKNNTKVDSFVIFMFNNVKSVHKITFFQPNNVLFNAKMLSLHGLYPHRKPQWAEAGQTYIW